MNYSTWVTSVADEIDILQTITNPALAAPSSDPNFNAIIAPCIDYVENRIQTDLDLLATRVTDVTGTLSINNRLFPFPTDIGIYLVIEQMKPIVGGIPQPPMLTVSRDFIDSYWPSNIPVSTPSIPQYFCMYDNANALVVPAPDLAYPVEVVGTQRVAQMSATNVSNFLTLSMPQLYIAASMVFLTGYQHDFGTQSSDPQMSQSWEAQYQLLKTGLEVEEARKKWSSVGWSSRIPSPVATPPQS